MFNNKKKPELCRMEAVPVLDVQVPHKREYVQLAGQLINALIMHQIYKNFISWLFSLFFFRFLPGTSPFRNSWLKKMPACLAVSPARLHFRQGMNGLL